MRDDQFIRWTEIHATVAGMSYERAGAPKARKAETTLEKSRNSQRVFRFFEPTSETAREFGRSRRDLALIASFSCNILCAEFVLRESAPFNKIQQIIDQDRQYFKGVSALHLQNEQRKGGKSRLTKSLEGIDLNADDIRVIADHALDLLTDIDVAMTKVAARLA